MTKNRVLDLGCGRDWIQYKDRKDCNIVCVDKLYNNENMVLGGNYTIPNHITLEPHEISSFLENYVGVPFDIVKVYRVFEHVHYDQISYYLYLIYKVMKPGGTIEIIVPNFLQVFEKLQHFENNFHSLTPSEFNNTMIMLHTEIFNEINDPHQSIWTPALAEYYLTLEGYYEVKNLQENVILDNRDWYFKVTAKTVDGKS